MIDVKIKDRELQDKREAVVMAGLKCVIQNAPYGPHLKKGDRYPYKLTDFLPKDLIPKREISEEEKTKSWMAAGNAMMIAVDENRGTGKNGTDRRDIRGCRVAPG